MTALTNPTPEQLSEAVAVHVAGWKHPFRNKWIPGYGPEGEDLWCQHGGIDPETHEDAPLPDYARSADAVLPLLNRWGLWSIEFGFTSGLVLARLWKETKPEPGHSKSWSARFEATASSEAEAACIALLRAHGVEVVVTNTNDVTRGR